MKKGVISFLLFSFLFVTGPFASAQNLNNAITRIYAINSDNYHGRSGTGFFIKIKDKAYICTAYHLITHAATLKIECCDGDLKDLSVAGFDQEKDILLLNFSTPALASKILYLSYYQYHPFNLTSKHGTIIGHPRTLSYLHVNASFTNDTVIPAQQFSNQFKRNLNLKLLAIDATIYNGMSGAPIIVENQIAGFISGSFNEGGGLGWAIPAYYLTKINIFRFPLLQFSNLPALQMCNNYRSFNTLQNNFKYNDDLQNKYNFLHEQIDTIKSHVKEAQTIFNVAAAQLTSFKEQLEKSYSFKDFDNISAPDENFEYSIYLHFTRILNEMNAYKTSLQKCRDDLSDIEFFEFRRKDGFFFDTEFATLIQRLNERSLLFDNFSNNNASLFVVARDEARRHRDFYLVKKNFLKMFQNMDVMVWYLNSDFEDVDKFLSLNIILINAMIECQSYTMEE